MKQLLSTDFVYSAKSVARQHRASDIDPKCQIGCFLVVRPSINHFDNDSVG